MKKPSIKCPQLISLVVVAVLLATCLTSCAFKESPSSMSTPANGATADESTNELIEPELVRISIMNGSGKDGLASRVGEMLIKNGYTYDNGFTIDISNCEVSMPKSFLLIPEGNSRLENEAAVIQSIVKFPIEVDDMRFDAKLKINGYFNNDRAIIIILGLNSYRDPFFDDSELIIGSAFKYTVEDAKLGRILQIEPRIR